MVKTAATLRLSIDHRWVMAPEGVTILRAAELNGIEIPRLCFHQALAPHGGCRLCVVQVEGMRGYPLACTTRAEPDQKVLTDTGPLRELRREVLQLILSEHPSSCLACDESYTCGLAQTTIRKSGVPTGCRFCPADHQCELQALVEKLGISDLDYPIRYKSLDPEHDDPFFDRDYNLCILCGRCVRMCQEVRLAGVLSFVNRGADATIGTAFGENHVAAGCEFCGACVSVCPTGALWEKGSKWDGKPDGNAVSTCPMCSVGCQLELHHKGGRLSRADGHPDPEINDGQLCVRGRFCLPEATHHHDRVRKPHLRRDPYFRQVDWEAALTEVAGKLGEVRPEDFLMLASGDLSNEALFAAQQFVREDLGSTGLDTTASRAYPGGPALWSELFSRPISVHAIADADAVLTVGLDRKFSLSVLGVKVRQATSRGAALLAISANDSDLARDADQWLQPTSGGETAVLLDLVRRLGGEAPRRSPHGCGLTASDLREAAELLRGCGHLAIIVGPQVFSYDRASPFRETIERLDSLEGVVVNLVPVAFGANLRGVLELGVLPGLLPGGRPAPTPGITLDDLETGRKRPKVLYLVGEAPFLERPAADYIIAQDLYPPPFEVDAFLPAASFAEAGGTLTNLEGRVQEIRPVEGRVRGPSEDQPGAGATGRGGAAAARVGESELPDWTILAELTHRLGGKDRRDRDPADILREIAQASPGFPDHADRRPRALPFRVPPALSGEKRRALRPTRDEMLLVGRPAGFRHRGVDLASKVEGLGELGFEEGFVVNPADAEQLGLTPGDLIEVAPRSGRAAEANHAPAAFGNGLAIGPVRAEESCPPGVIQYWRPTAFGGLDHRRGLAPLFRLSRNPVPARVARHE